ncbi:MAG TPA: FHA domain-containing protein [Cryomorphaceae bacterium]|nr:FHA domain-containing protein [Cryomorphaceae bacterium]
MATKFQCTNPLCGESVSVPEGAVQVKCKHCNTLHFTADLNLSESEPIERNDGTDVGNSDYDMSSSDLDLSHLPQADDVGLSDDQYQPSPQEDFAMTGGEIRTAPNQNNTEQLSEQVETKKAAGYLRTENGDYLALKMGKNVIGRSNADLILSDSTVSRKHCVIEVSGEGEEREFIIYDIGHVEDKPSTNGVFLSGRTLRLQDYERLPLKDGTTLEIGTVQLVFYKENG